MYTGRDDTAEGFTRQRFVRYYWLTTRAVRDERNSASGENRERRYRFIRFRRGTFVSVPPPTQFLARFFVFSLLRSASRPRNVINNYVLRFRYVKTRKGDGDANRRETRQSAFRGRGRRADLDIHSGFFSLNFFFSLLSFSSCSVHSNGVVFLYFL